MTALLVALAALLVAANAAQLLLRHRAPVRDPGVSDPAVVRRFAEIWWDARRTTLFANRWLGVPTLQQPLDAWVTQEIISEVNPDVIVETGSFRGGSAAMWATILEQLNPNGRVISIDVEDRIELVRRLPVVQRRVEFLFGSSIDPAIIQHVKRRIEGSRVLVILDSDHTMEHVRAELDTYAPLVSPGSYLVVQDGVVNGHPLEPKHGPGPWEAVFEFLATDDRFEVDRERERMLFTFNPNGFLRRKSHRVDVFDM